MSAENNPMVRRCPRLGNPIAFPYCMKCGENNGVCFKILDCWWEVFDVASYLKDALSPEDFQKLAAAQETGPQSKMASLLKVVEKVSK
ncbi:hypothetical protein SAMN02745216_04912 [Desulfatibacillum alkenivorans DSM 16219]|jgi:hypothetical protein|uniref:Uncharacterized protein n=1 Tax=Desulfatibacillum alkenivorans DSM 16219 TaxID=1121393 RepID=A0A1M6Z665_9BACT|nr:hypothetical protein [Desulfatibacillum alkenivorans]SHL25954.1 hypothetical protein SAMN02745216_04912 [Desulfatibacillum alkenivorans DSM 16219]